MHKKEVENKRKTKNSLKNRIVNKNRNGILKNEQTNEQGLASDQNLPARNYKENELNENKKDTTKNDQKNVNISGNSSVNKEDAANKDHVKSLINSNDEK